jgi:hypothetical protein
MFGAQQVRAWQTAGTPMGNMLGASPIVGGLKMAGMASGTVGMAGGAALGAVGGYNNHSDMKALGHSDATALASGAFVGVGEAAIAMFVPGGAIAVGIGEGLHLLINKFVNEPREKEPANNPDAPNEIPGDKRIPSQMTPAQKAAYYRDVAANEKSGMTTAHYNDERLFSEDDQSRWARSQSATKEARRWERQAAKENAPLTSEEELERWTKSQGQTYVPTRDWSDPNSKGTSGGEKAGMAQVRKIDETGDGGRVITLQFQMPPSQMERDMGAITQKPF